MARTFANPSGVTCSPGAVGTLLGNAFTFASIIRRTSDNDFHAIISLEATGPNHRGGLWVTNGGGSGGDLQVVSSGFDTSFGFTIPNNVWVFVAVTKPDGDGVTPSGWMYRYDTDAWSTASGAGTINEDSMTITIVRIGNSQNADFWFIGDIAIGAGWSVALADAQIRQLPFSLQSWYSSAPTFGHLLDQHLTTQNVVDFTGGGANQTGLSNTSVATTSLPIFSYGDTVSAPHSVPVAGDVLVTPSVVSGTTSIASPTIQAGSTVTPSVVSASVTVSGSAQAGSVTTPSVVIGSTSIPAPTVSASSTISAVTVASVVSISGTAQAGAVATPTTVAATTSIPTPSITAGGSATATPAVVAATTTIPAPTLSTGSTIVAVTVVGITSVPAPTIQASSIVTPTTVAAIAAVHTPAVSAGGSATAVPSTVAGSASIPAPTVQASSTVSAATVQATTSVPLPTIPLGPTTVAAVAVIATPTIIAGSTIVASNVSATTTIPTPTIIIRTQPSVVLCTVAIAAPTIISGSSVSPAVVLGSTSIPFPTIVAIVPPPLPADYAVETAMSISVDPTISA